MLYVQLVSEKIPESRWYNQLFTCIHLGLLFSHVIKFLLWPNFKGLTVKTEDGQLVIARILAGGAVDRQGLLHVGDIIGEVNGIVVRSAEQLQVEQKY